MKKMLGICFPQKCELSSHFPVCKQNLKSVASQTTEKILAQILWGIPIFNKESLHKKFDSHTMSMDLDEILARRR